jgi:hypothetical protein
MYCFTCEASTTLRRRSVRSAVFHGDAELWEREATPRERSFSLTSLGEDHYNAHSLAGT